MCSQCKSASLQQRRVRIGVFGAAIADSGYPSFSATLLPDATGIRLHLYDQNPDIRWNFTKFLVGRDGKGVGRFRTHGQEGGGIDAAIVSVL